jgi:hypothetical protein
MTKIYVVKNPNIKPWPGGYLDEVDLVHDGPEDGDAAGDLNRGEHRVGADQTCETDVKI